MINKEDVLSSLTGARALIAKCFFQGWFAGDENGNEVPYFSPIAVSFCSLGALYKTNGPGQQEAEKLLGKASLVVWQKYTKETNAVSRIARVNDSLGQKAALEMFDLAIELAEKS